MPYYNVVEKVTVIRTHQVFAEDTVDGVAKHKAGDSGWVRDDERDSVILCITEKRQR